jgi:hypothetical protein
MGRVIGVRYMGRVIGVRYMGRVIGVRYVGRVFIVARQRVLVIAKFTVSLNVRPNDELIERANYNSNVIPKRSHFRCSSFTTAESNK